MRLHRFASVVSWILRRRKNEHGLDEELQTFVELSVAEKIRHGVPPVEARRLAMLELGGIEQVKERVRTERHGGWADEIARDVRYVLRTFARNPGFSLVVVMTLALAIGANTAIFSLIDALTLRWLPVRSPQELVQLRLRDARAPQPGAESFSYPIVRALSEQDDIFTGVAGFSAFSFDVGSRGFISRVPGAFVSGEYYEMLGVIPAAGRLLTPADDRPGAPPVAVISYGYWDRWHTRSGDVLGETMLVNGAPVTIVGVTARGFVGTNVGAVFDITLPVNALPQVSPGAASLLDPGNFWLRVLARPQPALPVAQAAARLNVFWAQTSDSLIAPHWPPTQRKAMANSWFELYPGGTGWTILRDDYSEPLYVLMACVGLVLLIACANVASLLLARASVRRQEVGIRMAIGAGRTRIVRQLLIESTLLSLTGAAVGIGYATLSRERMMATLAGGFGVLALTVACVGLYGLLAYNVAQRTREIGIRMALGARPRLVVAHILEVGARLLLIGVLIGLPAAWAASRWIETLLFGLEPTDPAAIGTAIVILVAGAQVAAYLPARRASRIDPLMALRHE
ncbi:MAG TPA: FtsX-like permease family protein [Vicinamibacterales bacterium]|nr:FtsX-like permease family protein [Vicinamibacterales bacterium]